ncbi:hypothetical protein WME97_17705 [Sorangium sp. So ce367]|uniref:hypothetical protein n=1 Tax=Sorangium sp. So ce367 TaxID=3133305 RepID=UPI003F62417D
MSQETVISLESYAAVMAGLGAGLDLRRALAHAGVAPAAWEQASEQWQARIDESAASDLAVLVAFDAALLTAKRRFEPTFEPIESDVRAWAHFRRHFVTATEPIAFLARHDLDLATYARIEAGWANRVLLDEMLAATLRGHMEGALEDCPALTRTPSPLLAATDAEPAPALVVASPAVVTPAVVVPQVVAQQVVQPPAVVQAQVASEIVEPPRSPPPPPPPPPSMRDARAAPGSIQMGTTVAVSAVPFPEGLPFQRPAPPGQAKAEEAPPPIPLERYAVMLADHTLFGMTEAQLCEKHQLTPAQRAQAFQYWKGRVDADAALRGRVKVAVDRYQAARAKAGQHAPERSSPRQPAIAQAPNPPAAERRVDFNRTVDPGEVVMSPILPFLAGSSPAPRPTASAGAEPQGGAGGPGQLSLEQYASLTVDLSLDPERTPETLRRYGLTPAQRTLVDATWTARLAQNAAERSAFEAARASYRAWRLRNTSKP